jgi:predicted acyl esterase
MNSRSMMVLMLAAAGWLTTTWMAESFSAEHSSAGLRHEYTFATMSDGVNIALAVGYPRGFDPADTTRRWPAIFRTSGYPGSVVPANPAEYGDRFVTVQASIRGTGASGGTFGPWEPRTWQDGYEIIEDWIVRQPWSDGKVGIHGFSWPGLLGFLTASTQPPSLKAVCVGGLIDDFYHGICYPGGVRNCGFPVDWINNFYRPDGVFGSDAAARQARGLDDASFQAILQSRPPRDLTQDTLWLALQQPLDGPQWREMSLNTYAQRIRAPILITHAWQDEQTGPTGWQLWKRLADDVPKRLVVGNGDHGTCPQPLGGANAWFGHWLLDHPDQMTADSAQRVEVYFESAGGSRRSAARNPPLLAADFPLPQTQWTRFYLRSGQKLSTAPPNTQEPASRYRILHAPPGGQEQFTHYLLAFDQPTAICGPVVLSLWAELSTVDTDFFALLADRAPDGRVYGLQRGLLRASHRMLDAEQSDWVEYAGERLLVRPRHRHDAVHPVPPHQPVEYQIEIPAVGHVFRPGHQLVLVISRPPGEDPIGVTRSGEASYRYASNAPPGVVKILHDDRHPSNLLLPMLPDLPPLGAPLPPGDQAGLQGARIGK